MSAPYVRTKSQTVTATPASITITGKGKEVLLSSTTNCYVSFVGPAISGDALYLPANYPITIKSPFIRTVSVVRDTADGVLTVSESSNVAITRNTISSFTSNANFRVVYIPSSVDGDANLKKTVAATLSSDATMFSLVTDTFAGDSILTTRHIDTMTGDASLLTTVSGLFDASALLVTP